MRRVGFLVSAATVFSVSSLNATPLVEVRFVNPESYADALPNRPSLQRERDEILAQLRHYIEASGAQALRHGDHLTVEILDLDLAGALEAQSGNGRDVRVVRNRPLPMLHLRFSLTREGMQSAGEVRLTDLGSLGKGECTDGPTLCHEKKLLRQWLDGLPASQQPKPDQ